MLLLLAAGSSRVQHFYLMGVRRGSSRTSDVCSHVSLAENFLVSFVDLSVFRHDFIRTLRLRILLISLSRISWLIFFYLLN